ncbi:MAG: toxin-antitoxin system YwqK family antitoxin [Planctomycetota bacterium]
MEGRQHENGSKEYQGEWNQGKRTGFWFWRTASGATVEEGTYLDGKRHGEFSFFHKNGILKETGEYLDDKRIGEWKETDNTATEIARHNYNDAGVLTSTVWLFLGEEVSLIEKKNDAGAVIERWTESKTDQSKHGYYKRFYPTGEVLEAGKWLAGKKHGVWRTFDIEGNLVSKTEFENGVEKIDE